MAAVVKAYNHITHWFNKQVFFEKLYNPLGYVLLISIAIALGYVISALQLKYGFLILIAIIGVPVLGACLFNQTFSVVLILTISISIELLRKYSSVPFGTALDGLLFLSFFGLLLNQLKERRKNFAKSPVSVFIMVWVLYNLMEVLNPWAGSRMAWLYTVRSMAGLILFYFIACYAFKDLRSIIITIKTIIILAFISALYGLKQEIFGFTTAELSWLYADPERFQLIFQWSRMRIFSFFSDPTNFGIYMGYMGTFCFVMATGPFKMKHKIWLAIGGGAMFLAMAYAGSRTPFVLVPFGFLILIMMTLEKKYIIGMAAVFVLGTGVMMKSTSSAVMYRIQSAFDPTKSDDTMKVRLENQSLIQPFIYRHPFGAGLGSSGIWGKRFTPDSFLADFAHDSGFVRIAVELGWIGLTIYCLFLFTVIRTAIYYYLRVRNPKIRHFYLCFIVIFFMLTLANYPQEAIVQLPTSLVFYVSCAAIVKMKDFDDVAIENEKASGSESLLDQMMEGDRQLEAPKENIDDLQKLENV